MYNFLYCEKLVIQIIWKEILDPQALRKISCAAKDNKIYVVINIAEKAPCTDVSCPRDKMFYYNSNVVFDRTGKIIARYLVFRCNYYYKIHLAILYISFN